MNPYLMGGNPYLIPQQQQQQQQPMTLQSIMQLLMQIDAMRGKQPEQGTAASPMGGNFAGGASAFPNALGGMGMFGGGGGGFGGGGGGFGGGFGG